MKRRHLVLPICMAAGVLAFGTAPAQAQTHAWLAWHGCWRADAAPAGEYLCIVPDGVGAVRMLTVGGQEVLAESRVVTDGRPRPVRTEGCTGTEMAVWSADAQRVFLTSELSCEAGVRRHASGVFSVTGVDSWTSVQAITIDDNTATRTVTYTAVPDVAAPAAVRSALLGPEADRLLARRFALTPLDAVDVDEAIDRIDAAAVQEWLVATGQPFELAGDDAGIRSALDHTASFAERTQYAQNDVRIVERPVVHVVERPVYVTHVHEYRYRSCWDPFFSGLVLGVSRSVTVVVGQSHCGTRYWTHYSPWGYDLFGWRFVRTRPIILRGRPVVYYRDPPRWRPPTRGRDDWRDRERDQWRDRDRTTTDPRQAVPVRAATPREPPPPRTAVPRNGTTARDVTTSRAPSTSRTAQARTTQGSTPAPPATARTATPRSSTTVRESRDAVSTPPRTAAPVRERSSAGTAAPRTAVPRASSPARASTPPSREGTGAQPPPQPPASGRVARSRGGGDSR